MPKEKLAMAIVAPPVQALLQTERSAVYVSADTLVKQMIKREGQPIDVSHYETLQALLDGAQVAVTEGPLKVAYWRHDTRLWLAVLKATRARDEVYLVSLRRARAKDLAARLTPDERERLGI
jgi:hypothetical protein